MDKIGCGTLRILPHGYSL